MKTYRARFTLASPSLTPWRADTIFGHICWALAHRHGEEALQDLLASCREGNPPLIVSDGMPADRLPRPMFPPRYEPAGSVAEKVRRLRSARESRGSRWLNPEAFARALAEPDVPQPGADEARQPFHTLHNQISRETGTTSGADDAEEGRLFPASGEWLDVADVYIRVADDIALPWQDLLGDLAAAGYGKRKSAGYGHVRDLTIVPWSGFGEPQDADGFVSLSSYVPAADDPTEGFWTADVKHGKLGEERATARRPFKRPLLRLAAGAAFRTGKPPRPWYGRLVDGVSAGFPDAADCGFAFAVGLRWPKDAH